MGRKNKVKYIISRTILYLFISIALNTTVTAQKVYLHSHNDYEQENPLYRALSLGYHSIEIDVVLYKN